MGAPRWFALRSGTVAKHLLNLFASGPDRSAVAVDDADVGIAVGCSLGGRASRDTVTSARTLAGTVFSRGIHGRRGGWLGNGARDVLVAAIGARCR